MVNQESNAPGDDMGSDGREEHFQAAERFANLLIREKRFPEPICRHILATPWQDVPRSALLELIDFDSTLLAVVEVFHVRATADLSNWGGILARYVATRLGEFSNNQQAKGWIPPVFLAFEGGEPTIGFAVWIFADGRNMVELRFESFPTYDDLRGRFDRARKETADQREKPAPAPSETPRGAPTKSAGAEEKKSVPIESTTPPPAPDPVTISGSNVNDVAAKEDSLGFKPYVDAVAQFLLHEDTTAPLTMSIEGEWGSGKSSFMKQLQIALEERAAESGKDDPKKKIKVRTVWFNPWRHDKNEELWAAFALEFIKQLAKGRTWWRNLVATRLLTLKRISDWGGIIWESFRFAAVVTVWMIVAGAIIVSVTTADGGLAEVVKQIGGDKPLAKNLTWLFTGSSLLGGAVFGLMALKKVKEFVGNPLEHDFKKYVDAPNYAERTAFIERFHEDFKNIVETYADGAQVFVFIDDLDRCEYQRPPN